LTAQPHSPGDEPSLDEVLEERNRLWEELQRQRAMEADLEYWRNRAKDIESSRWWRAGAPLRLARRLFEDPSTTLEQVAFRIKERRRER
jgi:hypothetical protein